jgi:ubiquinone/menaquinone biosynthesis C-methylase UbiE
MLDNEYLMENDEESLRLDLKTDNEVTARQALWAGLQPGMRVADIGCGCGKTTSKLYDLVQPGGSAVGIDSSEQRINFAIEHYGRPGIEFLRRAALGPLDDIGTYDFIWVRFLLEYYLTHSFDLVKNLDRLIKPGGILCLIDLDYNCLSHYGLPPRMERTIQALAKYLEEKADFDPYVGRKLYSFLYDLGYEEINVDLTAHHLIYGPINKTDEFNWTKKVEVGVRNFGFSLDEYQGGYEEFYDEFKRSFADPRRFTYTPVICCRGRKPVRKDD